MNFDNTNINYDDTYWLCTHSSLKMSKGKTYHFLRRVDNFTGRIYYSFRDFSSRCYEGNQLFIGDENFQSDVENESLTSSTKQKYDEQNLENEMRKHLI